MKRLLFPSLIVLPLCAYAATGTDAMFYKHAAEGGIAEVDLGNLALKKSQDPAVKEFAASASACVARTCACAVALAAVGVCALA